MNVDRNDKEDLLGFIVKINTRVRYAVRLMADIAKHAGGGPVPLKDVAERQGLSKLYLSQLTMPLRNASLLRSVWGNKGGYVLGMPASEITMLNIIEAVDGPVSVIDCALAPDSCDRSDYCECISVWRDINEGIVRTLERHTLEDLIAKGSSPLQPTQGCAAMASRAGDNNDSDSKREDRKAG